MVGELAAEGGEIEVAKHAFSATDEDRQGDEVQLVNEMGAQISLDGRGFAAGLAHHLMLNLGANCHLKTCMAPTPRGFSRLRLGLAL